MRGFHALPVSVGLSSECFGFPTIKNMYSSLNLDPVTRLCTMAAPQKAMIQVQRTKSSVHDCVHVSVF